jgi:hypothetical protein
MGGRMMGTKLTKVWELTPHSKATNSLELMQEVKEAILEEPKRVYMQTFYQPYLPTDNPNINRGPVCGTIGCIAGWMDTMTCPTAKELALLDINADDRAYVKLPPEARNDAYDLFYGSDQYPFPSDSLYGTDVYADAVAANIQKFIDRWEDELREFQIEPPKIRG